MWAFGQMTLARIDFVAMRDCRFWKLCGSGSGEGFMPRPNTAVWAILACWPDEATARTRIAEARVYRRWRRRAAESWTVFLRPVASRGAWTGRQPFVPEGPADRGALAALTRASIRPRALLRFWERVPDISAGIRDNRDVLVRIGLGEMPWLHQITFSIWPDADSMARFARSDGPHAEAIRAVREGDWFAEELYARFAVTGSTGLWDGVDPLTTPREAA